MPVLQTRRMTLEELDMALRELEANVRACEVDALGVGRTVATMLERDHLLHAQWARDEMRAVYKRLAAARQAKDRTFNEWLELKKAEAETNGHQS